MYTNQGDVEQICYEDDHIQEVLHEIRASFDGYFTQFIETRNSSCISAASFEELQRHFGVGKVNHKKQVDSGKVLKDIIRDSLDAFEKERQAYLKIFDMDSLLEYREGDDEASFKSIVLHNECPVIRKTLANRQAKELDEYRANFNRAKPDQLLAVVIKLCEFAEQYRKETYRAESYDSITNYHELQLDLLDTDEYTYYGVIGGGIKTLMLFNVAPEVFPSRSRNALWALWYLSGKKVFGCKTDSEFLMINASKVTTQQNYFYPYRLFAFYAYEIYKMIRDKANTCNAYIDPSYRYVIVDAFFDFIADQNSEQISLMTHQIRENGGNGYA